MERWSTGLMLLLPITPILHSLAKLVQESQVVLKKQANIVDAVFEHRDALNAHTEGEAGNVLRIVADKSENCRVDHAGTENLQPTGGFANPAGLT